MSRPTLTPQEIRRQIAALRKQQDPAQARAAGIAACSRLLQALPNTWIRGRKIALYRALPGELDPAPLHRAWIQQKALLYYPRVSDKDARVLEFALASPAEKWIPGHYGIEEPPPEQPILPPNHLNLILLPGLAFGENGERIGTGAGFYDRALEKVTRPLRVALAFDFQVFQSLPQNEWDQKVDWVLTESRDLRTPRASAWLTQQPPA